MLEAKLKSNFEPILNLRDDFPTLKEIVHGHPLVYFDNAATTQKPMAVIEAMNQFYSHDNANVHRGVHALSERATLAYEGVRDLMADYIHANSREEIIFTKGTTEAINLVAQCFGESEIKDSDEIIITMMEHHANIVPWQLLAGRKNAVLRVVNINEAGELDLNHLAQLINSRTRLIAVSHISNVLGTINPVATIIKLAHEKNVPVLIDGAQTLPHFRVNMQTLDCDFYAFSGHKMYGPTGVGVLYARKTWLEKMPPYQAGGDMIKHVSFERTLFNDLPYKFEAGTPNIAGVIGLGAAVRYLKQLDLESIHHYEMQLHHYLEEKIQTIDGIKIYGNSKNKAPITTFTLADIHPHDIATLLDREGIAVRAGHHCAMPLMQFYDVAATLRASLAFYNQFAEVDRFVAALKKIQQVFSHV